MGRGESLREPAKRGVSFDEAVTVFDDPSAIGFSATGRLLTVVPIEFDGESIRIISARRASPVEAEIYDQ